MKIATFEPSVVKALREDAARVSAPAYSLREQGLEAYYHHPHAVTLRLLGAYEPRRGPDASSLVGYVYTGTVYRYLRPFCRACGRAVDAGPAILFWMRTARYGVSDYRPGYLHVRCSRNDRAA